jgi:membrane-associated phospholipid phosphatase
VCGGSLRRTWLACLAIVAAAPPASGAPDAAAGPAPAPERGFARRYADLTGHLGRCWNEPDAGHARDWLAFGLLAGVLAGVEFGVDPPREPRWSGRNDFDDAIRSGLRGKSRKTRDDASTASSVLTGAIGAGLAGSWLVDCGRESEDERTGLLWSVRNDGSWLLAGLATTSLSKAAAGRQRPYVRPCAADPDYAADCSSGRDDNTSFLSGHTATAATMAGLLCARHLGGLEMTMADVAWCGLPVAGAVATGLLRIASDKHYATDVIGSWVSGALFGYVLPRQFLYDGRRRGAAVRPMGGLDATGLELVVTF